MDRLYLESLRNLAILEMILRERQKVKNKPWDSECKVFIGGLKHSVSRLDLIVSKSVSNVNLEPFFLGFFLQIWTCGQLLGSKEAGGVRLCADAKQSRS